DEAPRMDDRAISVSLAPKLQDPALLVALRMQAPFAVAILFLMTNKPDALPALIVTFATAAIGAARSRIPGEAKTATVSGRVITQPHVLSRPPAPLIVCRPGDSRVFTKRLTPAHLRLISAA